MVACARIARFDHFCEVDNNFVLHVGDAFCGFLEPFDEFDRILAGLDERLVQVFNFVAGTDVDGIQFLDAADVALFQVVGKVDGARCHAVHGVHDAALHELEHDAHDDNREPEEHRQKLDEELGLVDEDFAHGDVGGDVGDCPAEGILERLVHGQEPTVLVIGNDWLDGFALQELGKVWHECRVEWDDRARIAARFAVGRIEVEYHVAAVIENLVHVQVKRLREPVSDLVELGLDILVAFGLFALLYELVHSVGVYGNGGRLG